MAPINRPSYVVCLKQRTLGPNLRAVEPERVRLAPFFDVAGLGRGLPDVNPVPALAGHSQLLIGGLVGFVEVVIVKHLFRHLADSVFVVEGHGVRSGVGGRRAAVVRGVLILVHVVVDDGLVFSAIKGRI